MKTNKFADLVRHGLSVKSLLTLSESDINKLHILYEGKKEVCPKCKKEKCECKEGKKKMETKEQDSQMTPMEQLPLQTITKKIRTLPPTKSTNVKGAKITAGSSPAKIEVEGEMKEEKNSDKNNPWAICHAQVGPKKTKKFERCVRAVKASMKENKLPFDRILENKILSLVEKHLRPKMKKSELMNLIGGKKMNLPIGKLSSMGAVKEEEETKTKPKTKPTTKPGEKKPLDPFKPSPDKKPAPKAKKSETKEAFMDAPVKEPTTRPTTKPGEKPVKPLDPFRPDPSKQPAPKAKRRIPDWLKFDNLGIKFKK